METLSAEGIESDRSHEDADTGINCGSSGSSDRMLRQIQGELVLDSQSSLVQHYYVGTESATAADTHSDSDASKAS